MAPGARSKFGATMSKFEVVRKLLHCIEESTCAIVGAFRRHRSNSAPGELCPPFPPRYAPGLTNFNLQKCDETDLKECLPNITQSI